MKARKTKVAHIFLVTLHSPNYFPFPFPFPFQPDVKQSVYCNLYYLSCISDLHGFIVLIYKSQRIKPVSTGLHLALSRLHFSTFPSVCKFI